MKRLIAIFLFAIIFTLNGCSFSVVNKIDLKHMPDSLQAKSVQLDFEIEQRDIKEHETKGKVVYRSVKDRLNSIFNIYKTCLYNALREQGFDISDKGSADLNIKVTLIDSTYKPLYITYSYGTDIIYVLSTLKINIAYYIKSNNQYLGSIEQTIGDKGYALDDVLHGSESSLKSTFSRATEEIVSIMKTSFK